MDQLARAGVEARGAVFTRTEVVDFMLELVGYTPDKNLAQERLLEPSFGEGGFLLKIVERLLASLKRGGEMGFAYDALRNSVRAVELHQETYVSTKERVRELLVNAGVRLEDALRLCDTWLVQDDFLLAELEPGFTHVVGNPPYVRQEGVPAALMQVYREHYRTIFDRADLYIPFFERGLGLLKEGGKLSFICSDRWMKNRYGGPLRQLIAEGYHVESYVDMVGTDAFQNEVSAYPAITTIVRGRGTTTRVAKRPLVERENLERLATSLLDHNGAAKGVSTKTIPNAVKDGEPWLLDCAEQLALIRRLEEDFAPLEAVGCKVGIGVASGCDGVYIAPYDGLEVEPDRKLPLVMASDIKTGRIEWAGRGIVNPFDEQGGLVDLKAYPKLARYFEVHREKIRGRNVAKRNPQRWYRTIDRIWGPLTHQPKLLIPDIKNEPNVVFDEGRFYPHHNLYWVTSKEWDLRALQTVLRSSVAKLSVWAYSVKMRGGYLRYQAQNLRRIPLPHWADLPRPTRARLSSLSESRDSDALDRTVFDIYGLSEEERVLAVV